jgi:hypothetical protein
MNCAPCILEIESLIWLKPPQMFVVGTGDREIVRPLVTEDRTVA